MVLLLQRLGPFQCPGDRLQDTGEFAVTSFAVGPPVTRLTPVPGFPRRRGHLRARRQRRGGGERVNAGDPVRTEQVWPADKRTIYRLLTDLFQLVAS